MPFNNISYHFGDYISQHGTPKAILMRMCKTELYWNCRNAGLDITLFKTSAAKMDETEAPPIHQELCELQGISEKTTRTQTD